MKAGRLLLVATLVASVAATSMAQGRGGMVERRGNTLTEQERQTLRNLRERHRREITELRSRHRDQTERALPPAARQRLEERRLQLQRQGRMVERQQMFRGRGGQLQRRGGPGAQSGVGIGGPGRVGMGGRGGPPMRGRMFGPRGRGMVLPDSGVRGGVRDGR